MMADVEPNIEARVGEIESTLETFVEKSYQASKTAKQAQVEQLVQAGAYPYKVFNELAGQRTRADNIGCGINGQATNEVLSEYFTEVAQTQEGDNKMVSLWLAQKSAEVAMTRRSIKELLMADQLTNLAIYEVSSEQLTSSKSPFYMSSLEMHGDAGIPKRTNNTTIQTTIRRKIEGDEMEFAQWKDLQAGLEEVGMKVAHLIIPGNMQGAINCVRTGYDRPASAEYFGGAIQDFNETKTRTSEELGHQLSDDEMGQAMTAFMEDATRAQAILEGQLYAVGIGLMRAVAGGRITPEIRGLLEKDLTKFIELETADVEELIRQENDGYDRRAGETKTTAMIRRVWGMSKTEDKAFYNSYDLAVALMQLPPDTPIFHGGGQGYIGKHWTFNVNIAEGYAHTSSEGTLQKDPTLSVVQIRDIIRYAEEVVTTDEMPRVAKERAIATWISNVIGSGSNCLNLEVETQKLPEDFWNKVTRFALNK